MVCIHIRRYYEKNTNHLRMISTRRWGTIPRRLGSGIVEVTSIRLCTVPDTTVRSVIRLLLVLLQHDALTVIAATTVPRVIRRSLDFNLLLSLLITCDCNCGDVGRYRQWRDRRWRDRRIERTGAGEYRITVAQPLPYFDSLIVTVIERQL